MTGSKGASSFPRYDWNMQGKNIDDSAPGRNWWPYIKYGSVILLAAFAVWILVVGLSG
ncbi:hypothetical protein ACFRAU_21830 [Arthrobacter sp. NPDC056691]|uniref:hypothetical protein n=1 Tax=unclassified Arthrobacter TaxID=235627 RepID=UPI0036702559